MQSFTLFVFVFGFATVAFADDERAKVCVKATQSEKCDQLKDQAKGLYRALKALDVSGTAEPTTDIPKYIEQLHELFTLTLRSECHVNICKCKDGALDCQSSRDDIKTILQKVEVPECLGENEKAKALLDNFKKALTDGDREGILSILGDLKKAIENAVAKGDQTKIDCITSTIKHIREKIQNRIKQSNFQPQCDFCAAPGGTETRPAILGAIPA